MPKRSLFWKIAAVFGVYQYPSDRPVVKAEYMKNWRAKQKAQKAPPKPKKLHWTQTVEGRRRLSVLAEATWAARKTKQANSIYPPIAHN